MVDETDNDMVDEIINIFLSQPSHQPSLYLIFSSSSLNKESLFNYEMRWDGRWWSWDGRLWDDVRWDGKLCEMVMVNEMRW